VEVVRRRTESTARRQTHLRVAVRLAEPVGTDVRMPELGPREGEARIQLYGTPATVRRQSTQRCAELGLLELRARRGNCTLRGCTSSVTACPYRETLKESTATALCSGYRWRRSERRKEAVPEMVFGLDERYLSA
jgi:hypothetical protein